MDRLNALQDFLREDPDDPFTRFALAQEYRRRGESNRALALLEDLRRDHPDYVGTYYHLGKLYEELDSAVNAVATYREGIERAGALNDTHSRSELQSALLEAQGVGFDDD